MQNEVFKVFVFFLDFHMVKGRKVRSRIVIAEGCFRLCHFFYMNEFEGLSPNVVEYNKLCIPIFIFIFKTKDPYISEINEVSPTVWILLLHLHTFGVAVEGKADLPNRGRLLIFCCIDNEVLKEWTLIDLLLIIIFLICDEVDVWLHFTDSIHLIVDCVYTFVGPHFCEFSFRVVREVKIWKLHCLLISIGIKPKLGVVVAGIQSVILFELMLPFNGWFGVVLSHIFYIEVYQLATMASVVPHPANQFCLFEVCYESPINLRIHSLHCGAPFFVGLQIDQP